MPPQTKLKNKEGFKIAKRKKPAEKRNKGGFGGGGWFFGLQTKNHGKFCLGERERGRREREINPGYCLFFGKIWKGERKKLKKPRAPQLGGWGVKEKNGIKCV